MTGTSLTMRTSDDVNIAFDDEGSGRPFVLLPGYSSSRKTFEYQREALLAAGKRVIAVDHRGHGADRPGCRARHASSMPARLRATGVPLLASQRGPGVGPVSPVVSSATVVSRSSP